MAPPNDLIWAYIMTFWHTAYADSPLGNNLGSAAEYPNAINNITVFLLIYSPYSYE